MEMPSHPDAGNDAPHRQETTMSRATVALIVVVAAFIAVIVILHLTGVFGPGSN